MAKIVTITNPLTGQPAQVDQLDHTAQQIDDGLNIARSVSNPNLLDNWYFLNPIDQRQGYVVPPGTPYYKEMWTQSGTTSSYIKVKSINWDGNYGVIEIDGVEYFFTEVRTNAVRGYTGAGYGIDRWQVAFCGDNSAVTINDGYISFVVNNSPMRFMQTIEGECLGMHATVSVLTQTALHTFSGFKLGEATGALDVSVGNFYSITDNGKIINIIDFPVGTHNVRAAKIELGSQQTLAHQDADGNWVLNEIPNYGEQLARCQYYSDLPTTWAPMTFYVADFIVFTVKTHREMRVNLSSANVTLDSSKLEVQSNGEAQSGLTFSVYGGGDDFILVKAAKSGHGLSNAMLIVNNGGIYANANL